MRATEIIRSILDVIDHIDIEQEPEQPVAIATITEPTTGSCGDDGNRFKQIMDLLTSEYQMYDNSPNETVAGIESVTTHAGGGWNGPKNPADIRADSISMYPNFQAKQ